MTAALPPARVAHIGAGRFSRAAHGPVLRRLADEDPPRVTLAGVADLDRTRPERAREFRRDFHYDTAYPGLPELIAGSAPDLFVCIVEPHRNREVAATLLRTGKPLLLEKPPGRSAVEAAYLARLSIAFGTPHYVAFNRRRMAGIERARSWLREHGTPRYARAEMWREKRKAAQFVTLTGIHAIDTLRDLAGEIVWLHVEHVDGGGDSRHWRARLDFESGCRGELFLSTDAGFTCERYVFEYEDATRVEITAAPPYSDASVTPGLRVIRGGRICIDEPAPADLLVATGIAGEYDAFLDAVRTGRQADCSLCDAWKTMVVAEAIESGHRGTLRWEGFARAAGDDVLHAMSRVR